MYVWRRVSDDLLENNMWEKLARRGRLDPNKTYRNNKSDDLQDIELENREKNTFIEQSNSSLLPDQAQSAVVHPDYGSINNSAAASLSNLEFGPKPTLWNSFLRYQNLLFLPLIFETLEPVPKGKYHTATIFAYKILQSMQFTFGKVWPVIFLFTLLADLKNNGLNSDQRFGTTVKDILLGEATNQLTFSSDWGSEIPSDKDFMWAFRLMLLLPWAAGLVWSIAHTLKWASKFEEQDSDLLSYNKPRSSVQLYTDIRRWEWELRWNADLPSSLHQPLLDKIIVATTHRNFFVRYRSIKALASIARNFREERLVNIINDNDHVSIANQALRRIAAVIGRNRYLTKLYAHYKLWHIGHSKNKVAHVLFEAGFIITLALQLGAFIRYVEVLVKKEKALAKFNSDKKACEDDNKLWSYVTEIGNYDCLVCDFASVYYLERKSSQRCLDGYLAMPHSDTEVLEIFKQMSHHPDYKIIDFSHQNWPDWSNSVFEAVLKAIRDQMNIIDDLNLSTSDYLPWSQDETKIKILIDFLQAVTAKKVDVHNYGFGPRNIQTLMSGINGIATEVVDITATNAQDAGVIAAGSIVPNSHITTLRIGENGMTDVGLCEITPNIINSTLTDIDMSSNSFTARGFNTFTRELPSTRIEKFDASNNDLANADFYQWGQSLPQSKLTILNLKNTNVIDNQVVDLSQGVPGSSLASINLANNLGVQDLGATSLLASAGNSTIKHVNLSGTSLTGNGLGDSAMLLTRTDIENFAIAKIRSSVNGFCKILSALNSTQIESLNIDDNQVGNAIAPCLIQALSNPHSKLRTLNISRLNINEDTLIGIINALPNSNISELYLMDNGMTDRSATVLAAVLPRTRLKHLVISDNNIGPEGATKLADAFGQLETFILNGNPIGPEGTEAIIGKFISVPVGVPLGKSRLNRSQYRALHKANNKPLTSIKQLGLENTGLQAKQVRATCQVWPSTDSSVVNAHLKNNPTEKMQVDPLNCDTSSSSSLRSWNWLSSLRQFAQQTFQVAAEKTNAFFSLTVSGEQSYSLEYEEQQLKQYDVTLTALKKNHAAQKQSRAAHFEPLQEKFVAIATLYADTKKTINNAAQYHHLPSAVMREIENNLHNIQQMVNELSSANKTLHHIHIKEQRLQKRIGKTQQSVESVVNYDITTGNISHKVITPFSPPALSVSFAGRRYKKQSLSDTEQVISQQGSLNYQSNSASFWYMNLPATNAALVTSNVTQFLSFK
ncbi:MAG: hypothetical protein H0U71_08255 [Gammaproteobacteria bacterium]|nr:hypothetical protein [Gammaproteobacteria bacterium]